MRSPRALWLQIKSDNVEEMTRKILDFGARTMDYHLDCPSRSPIYISRRQGDNASSCSQSTRIKHITREPETVRTWQRKERPRRSRRKRSASWHWGIYRRNPIEGLEKEQLWQKVTFGNHSSVIVPRQDRDSIRKFYLRCPWRQNHEGAGRKGLPSSGRQLLHRVSLWGCP